MLKNNFAFNDQSCQKDEINIIKSLYNNFKIDLHLNADTRWSLSLSFATRVLKAVKLILGNWT